MAVVKEGLSWPNKSNQILVPISFGFVSLNDVARNSCLSHDKTSSDERNYLQWKQKADISLNLFKTMCDKTVSYLQTRERSQQGIKSPQRPRVVARLFPQYLPHRNAAFYSGSGNLPTVLFVDSHVWRRERLLPKSGCDCFNGF